MLPYHAHVWMTMMMMVSYFRKFNYNALLGVCCVTCGCVHGTLWSDRRLLWPSLVYVVLEELLEDVKNLSIKCTPELEEYIYLSMGVGIYNLHLRKSAPDQNLTSPLKNNGSLHLLLLQESEHILHWISYYLELHLIFGSFMLENHVPLIIIMYYLFVPNYMPLDIYLIW